MVPDRSRLLSGHPERFQRPTSSRLPAAWLMVAAGSRTAFTGPWGTSFATNLTPDPEAGLGQWTEENFIHTVRTGRHLWSGRPFRSPMRQEAMGRYSDAELKAIWAYLRSVPSIRNQVSAARPPTSDARPAGPNQALLRTRFNAVLQDTTSSSTVFTAFSCFAPGCLNVV